MKTVVVIGGGVAGIAAACFLAEQGVEVLLLERSSHLGGRAASFYHRHMGEEIDYGQHVLMRCCREAIDLLTQLGMKDAVCFQPRLSVPIACNKELFLLSSTPLPGLLHLLPSLFRYRHLRLSERLALTRAGIPLLLHDLPEDRIFADWLSDHGQGTKAIARLWDPICVAALNAHAEAVSARAAGMVYKKGFFKPHGADLGLFTLPLSRVFFAAVPYLQERGGEVRLKATVARILVEKGRAYGVELAGGERLDSEWVITAVPSFDLLPLFSEAVAREGFFARLKEILFSPIVNLHMWFDRPVMEEPFLITVEPPLQAIFDITRIQGKEGPTHLVLSQSAASDWIDLPVVEIRKRLVSALEALLPAVRTARLFDSLVIKSRRATLLLAPGSEPLRPGARTPIDRLLLAGDYTATAWPSTIEGAVRSGRAAAALVARGAGAGTEKGRLP